MSLLAQQVDVLTKAYIPKAPQATGLVHRIYDDPDEESASVEPKPQSKRREIKWIRASIVRAVESAESPLTIKEISDRTKLKWDRVRKSVIRLVEKGTLTKSGTPGKYRYTVAKEVK